MRCKHPADDRPCSLWDGDRPSNRFPCSAPPPPLGSSGRCRHQAQTTPRRKLMRGYHVHNCANPGERMQNSSRNLNCTMMENAVCMHPEISLHMLTHTYSYTRTTRTCLHAHAPTHDARSRRAHTTRMRGCPRTHGHPFPHSFVSTRIWICKPRKHKKVPYKRC